jgi:hypothetical protein
MGASQERAAFFNAKLLVVTRHPGPDPGGPQGRPKIHPALPCFALFFIKELKMHRACGDQKEQEERENK